MDRKYSCYCGFYCESCAVMAKVEPAAKKLYEEMLSAQFEDVVNLIPDGNEFWRFLKGMYKEGICISCRDGSGPPKCKVRDCAVEKGQDMCAFCSEYPCERFEAFFEAVPVLRDDNELLRDQGWDPWGKLQDERKSSGFTYSG